MNVMAQAHKKVKTLLTKITARYVGQYAAMLKVALIETHKEHKAMKTREQLIADVERQINGLKEFQATLIGNECYLYHTEAKILLKENEEKTRLSWGGIKDLLLPSYEIAKMYMRKYKGPIKAVNAYEHIDSMIDSLKKLVGAN